MQTIVLPIGPAGPLVRVEIALSAKVVQSLRKGGQPVPPAVTAEALIDSGSDVTCVDPTILAPLQKQGLTATKFIPINAPALGGFRPTGEYSVSLTILHPSGNPKANLVLRNQVVVDQEIGALGYQCLIGRDVLDRCIFVYDGPSRHLTLGY